jgi:hypothetical protein
MTGYASCPRTSARPVAVHRLEVVEPPGAVEAELFAQARSDNELFSFHALLGDVDGESHRGHATGLAARGLPASARGASSRGNQHDPRSDQEDDGERNEDRPVDADRAGARVAV